MENQGTKLPIWKTLEAENWQQSNPNMSHVFISYVHEDKAIIDEIYSELVSRGVNVWLDRKSIRAGMRWQLAIKKAIEEGAFFLACFSPCSTNRNRSHMYEELNIACEEIRNRSDNAEWFIPIRLAECAIPDMNIRSGVTLNSFQRVDLFPNWDTGIFALLNGIGVVSTHSQAMTNYNVHYELAPRTKKLIIVKRTTEYEAVNLTAKSVMCQPGFYRELNERGKFVSIVLGVYRASNVNWDMVYSENGKFVESVGDSTLIFKSAKTFEIPPGTIRSGSGLRVQLSTEMIMNYIDRDIISSLRPVTNVSVTCKSINNSFLFSVGDSPDIVELEPGKKWVLSKGLQARENLNVRWKPNK